MSERAINRTTSLFVVGQFMTRLLPKYLVKLHKVCATRCFYGLHVITSNFIFCEAVEELLECLRCIYIKTLLIYIDKVIINV